MLQKKEVVRTHDRPNPQRKWHIKEAADRVRQQNEICDVRYSAKHQPGYSQCDVENHLYRYKNNRIMNDEQCWTF